MGGRGPGAGRRSGTTSTRHAGSPAWSLLVPSGALRVEVPSGWHRRRAAEDRLASLPVGAQVVFLDGRPGARTRTRRLAARGGIVLEREYVVLPTLHASAFVVEDAPGPVRWLWRSVATVPPGVARGAAVVQAVVLLGRRLPATSLLGRVAPGRLAVGRRT